MATIDTSNYTIGGANLYFSSTVGHDDLLGTAFETSDHNMGNIVNIEINPEITYIDHWISVNGKRVKDKVVANVTSVMVPFTFDEMNLSNLERFFMGGAAGSKIYVMQNPLDEGCAKIVVQTDVGQDLVYNIPKCTIRPDGNLSLNSEDWHQAPMVLEVLQYQDGNVASTTLNATWLAFPFGMVDSADR